MATVLRCCAAQDPKPPLCCPTCTSTVDAPCRTPGYGTDNCDFQQVRGRLFRAAPCLQRLASSSCAHLVRPLARTTAGEKNWRRGKRTARMEARARTRLRITIASALMGGQVSRTVLQATYRAKFNDWALLGFQARTAPTAMARSTSCVAPGLGGGRTATSCSWRPSWPVYVPATPTLQLRGVANGTRACRWCVRCARAKRRGNDRYSVDQTTWFCIQIRVTVTPPRVVCGRRHPPDCCTAANRSCSPTG